MLKSLRDKWNSLRPGTRQTGSILLVISGFVILVSLVLLLTGNNSKSKNPIQIEEPKKSITLDPKLLEKTMTVKADQQAGKLEELQKQIEEMKKNGGVLPASATAPGIPSTPSPTNAPNVPATNSVIPLPGAPVTQPAMPSADARKSGKKVKQANDSLPPGFPPQGGVNTIGMLPPPPGAAGEAISSVPQREVIGDIEIITNPNYKQISAGTAGTPSSGTDADKKKVDRDIYLPPSYVEATLLNGLFAPTSEGARGNPVPVLLRIRDLAQLPNEVKANIRGCFIISEGVGNLSDERAHLRLKSLSCISKGGESIIDQPVKGFVVDADGKLGVSGTVVSKMGATISRSLIAGFFAGFGDALKQSSQYQSQTSGLLGTTSVMTADFSQMALAGLGQGVSSAANDLAKFYLELSKQTMPVVEVGAAKRVTLVFSEGVTLRVKEFERTTKRKKLSFMR